MAGICTTVYSPASESFTLYSKRSMLTLRNRYLPRFKMFLNFEIEKYIGSGRPGLDMQRFVLWKMYVPSSVFNCFGPWKVAGYQRTHFSKSVLSNPFFKHLQYCRVLDSDSGHRRRSPAHSATVTSLWNNLTEEFAFKSYKFIVAPDETDIHLIIPICFHKSHQMT